MSFDLDFINGPIPVEPSALSHGLHDGRTRQLDRTANGHLLPFLQNTRLIQYDSDSGGTSVSQRHASTKGRASLATVLNNDEQSLINEPAPQRGISDQQFFTLPKLPVKRSARRNRVPPVLQGLHQPPPDAGILPSINAEDTQVLLPPVRETRLPADLSLAKHKSKTAPPATVTEASSSKASGKQVARRNKWSAGETKDLLHGVARFGVGNWKKILLCTDYSFNKRTAVDLKDRFRICKSKPVDRVPGAVQGKVKPTCSVEDVPACSKRPSAAITEAESVLGDEGSAYSASHETTTQMPGKDRLCNMKRRQRRKFTKEEDDALLAGYQNSGAHWSVIVKDPVFVRNHRTPTDLRDRFRTRYSDKYAEAGLAPRPLDFPKPPPRTKPADDNEANEVEKSGEAAQNKSPHRTSQVDVSSMHLTRPVQQFASRLNLPHMNAEAWSAFDSVDEEDDANPVVLDRSIFDWVNDNPVPPPIRPPANTEPGSAFPGIDPLMTLKLPTTGLF